MLEHLQGRELLIDSIKLETSDNQLVLSLDVLVGEKKHTIVFRNVSSFCADRLNFPLQISGFEIKDNASDGWLPELRYKVCDFECDSLSFYCEEIEFED